LFLRKYEESAPAGVHFDCQPRFVGFRGASTQCRKKQFIFALCTTICQFLVFSQRFIGHKLHNILSSNTLQNRHPREGGDPETRQWNRAYPLDSRLRGNDDPNEFGCGRRLLWFLLRPILFVSIGVRSWFRNIGCAQWLRQVIRGRRPTFQPTETRLRFPAISSPFPH